MNTMDCTFENHGSIWLARPLTQAATDWMADFISDEAQWYGGALVIEPRYVSDIAEAMSNDGLSVGG